MESKLLPELDVLIAVQGAERQQHPPLRTRGSSGANHRGAIYPGFPRGSDPSQSNPDPTSQIA